MQNFQSSLQIRCFGHVFCDVINAGAHVCQPTSKENVTFHIMAVQQRIPGSNSGQWNTLCMTATVEKHTACKCSCKQTRGLISSTFFAHFFVRKRFFDKKKLPKCNFCTNNACEKCCRNWLEVSFQSSYSKKKPNLPFLKAITFVGPFK